MKKTIITIVLAALLICSMSVGAFANDLLQEDNALIEEPAISPKSMYYDHTFVNDHNPSNVYGNANIRVTVNATIDAQNGYIISINSYDVRMFGPFSGNAVWTNITTNCQITNSHSQISVYTKGSLSTSMDIGGINYGTVSEHEYWDTFS